MFATILGGLPRPPLPDDASEDELVAFAVHAQEALGLEPMVDGRLRWPDRYADGLAGFFGLARVDGTLRAPRLPVIRRPVIVDGWSFAASCTDRAVKQSIPGPYTLGRRLAVADGPDRQALTLALAAGLREEIASLAEAGCPLVEVEERDASAIGEDPAERALFRAAHEALVEGIRGAHLSLSIIGPSADGAGTATIFVQGYASFAFDLIDGPDNWRLVVEVPGEKGVVCGALATRPGASDDVEVLMWAADYAASTRGRGLDRVGLGTAGGLEHLAWDAAIERMGRLARGARVTALPTRDARAAEMDPRAVDIRSAGLGRVTPSPRRSRSGRGRGPSA